jgi:hypothetical protein
MKSAQEKTQTVQRLSIHVSIASHRTIAWIGERLRLACSSGAQAVSWRVPQLAETEKWCQ